MLPNYRPHSVITLLLLLLSLSLFGQGGKQKQLKCPATQKIYCGSKLQNYVGETKLPKGFQATQFPSAGFVVESDTAVTIEAVNRQGKTLSCSFRLQVEPQIICPTDTTLSCAVEMPDMTDAVRIINDCGKATHLVQFPPAGTRLYHQKRIKEIALQYQGGTASCKIRLSIIDTIPPHLICPNDTAVPCGVRLPNFIANMKVTDPCDSKPQLRQMPAPNTPMAGDTQVFIEAIDSAGNVSRCQLQVKVLNPLKLKCLSDTVMMCNSKLPDFKQRVGINFDCGKTTFMQSPQAGTVITSDTKVTLFASNSRGESDTCRFQVRMKEPQVTVTCPPDTFLMCGKQYLPDFRKQVEVSENCYPEAYVFQTPMKNTIIKESGKVRLEYRQRHHVIASCEFNLELRDPIQMQCPPNIDTIKFAGVIPSLIHQTGVRSACSKPTIWQEPVAGTPLCSTTVVTINATNTMGGKNACQVTITPSTPAELPMSCPKIDTIPCKNGVFLVPNYAKSVKYNPTCFSDVRLEQSPAAGVSLTKDTTVTLKLMAQGKVMNQCTFPVKLVTAIKITKAPSPAPIAWNAPLPSYISSVIYNEACSPFNDFTQTPKPGTIITQNTPVKITVKNDQGGRDSCTFEVKVIDPPINCPTDTTVRLLYLNYEVIYPEFAMVRDSNARASNVTQNPQGLQHQFLDDAKEGQEYLESMSNVVFTSHAPNKPPVSCHTTVDFKVKPAVSGARYEFTGPADTSLAKGQPLPNFADGIWMFEATAGTKVVQTPPPGSGLLKDLTVNLKVLRSDTTKLDTNIQVTVIQ